MQNELSAYQNATGSIEVMMRKHTVYTDRPQYQQVQHDVQALLNNLTGNDPSQTDVNNPTEKNAENPEPNVPTTPCGNEQG